MTRECKIGNVTLKNPFLLAPLAGVTDAPFRLICGEKGAGLVCSEMVSAKGLWYKDKNTDRLLEILDGEAPVAYQIFGHEPEIMAEAARMLNDRRHVLLDINMGCPVPKIVRNGEGSALMREPKLARRVVEAVVSASTKPVTVKIRAGWNDAEKNAAEVAQAIEAGGASAVCVHGRTRRAVLQRPCGLEYHCLCEESRQDSGDWKRRRDRCHLRLSHDAETGCDFVMIGRGALGNPWIFEGLARAWDAGVFDAPRTEGREAEPALPRDSQDAAGAQAAQSAVKMLQPEKAAELSLYDIVPSKEDKIEMMLRHFEDVYALKGEYTAVREMRKHVGWYLKGLPGAAAFRGRVNQINDAAALREAIRGI